jgi:hypothetical protein
VTTSDIRSALYLIAKIMGDLNAIQMGRVPHRVGRGIAGKITGRMLGRIS